MEEIKPYFDEEREPPTLELAGPRERIFFDSATIACGIVTCGGLCPGINNVTRFREPAPPLRRQQDLRFRYGYEGLMELYGHVPLHLTPESVGQIGELGGTILACSRGAQDPAEMLDTLVS